MLSRDPRVFTIPPGAPFLPTLADALTGGRVLDGFGRDPAALAEATIYLPTRRAARAFAALLAAQGDRRAQLLPRIVPLGEADDAEFALAGSAADDPAFEGAEALAPPIAMLERRLILTGLIQHWAETVDRARLKLADGAPLLVPASPADAVGFAGDLERLMDGFATEDIPWDQLAEAVETDYSEYFGLTLDFVRIAAENWPKILAERGASDPARRRSALIHAEARRLLAEKPGRPVIAAGSTGSMPATAALLNAIARLPNGAVVLPGLDTDLDEPSWTAIGGLETEDSDPVHGHPQAMLRRLLEEHLRMPRAAVRTLGSPPDAAAARARMVSEALRPADTTDGWADMDAGIRADLARRGSAGIKLVEAVDERDEALAAAIALRETLARAGPHGGARHARSRPRQARRRGVGALGHRGRGFRRRAPVRDAGRRRRAPRRRCGGARLPSDPRPRSPRPSARVPRVAARGRRARRKHARDRPPARTGAGAGPARITASPRGRSAAPLAGTRRVRGNA